MVKRGLPGTSATLLAGSLLPRASESEAANPAFAAPATAPRMNWARSYAFRADRLATPTSLEDLRTIVAAQAHLKALGRRHSFNDIADSLEEQISLEHFEQMDLNPSTRTVTLGAGVTYGKLAPYIDSRGFAVHNLASLPHIGVVGACATATHGSGTRNGNLTTAVRAFDVVTADGEIVTFSHDKTPEVFAGAVIGLGAFGVISSVTLAVEPRFDMTQNVYENLDFSQLERNLEAIFSSGYSTSLFTDWQKERATQVWIKRKVEAGAAPLPSEFYGAKAATRKVHPFGDPPAESCTDQLGTPGPWYERLPHFKMNFTPSSGAEIQSEYFVPRELGYQAIRAIEQLRDLITPHLFVTELRAIAADNLWISPAYQRPSMAIHFTWKPDGEAVRRLLPQIEARLAPFEARPHWAKVFTMDPRKLRALYPKMEDYLALVNHYDPKGKFRNAYLARNLYSA